MFGLVLQSWKASLSAFLPQTMKWGMTSAFQNCISVIKQAIKTLRWFLVADLCLTTILAAASVKKITSGPGFEFISGITDINWLVIYGSIILLIRKRDATLDTKTYLMLMFFNYVKVLFIFMIFSLLFLGSVVLFGITQFPAIHWSLKAFFEIFQLLIIFYWLDSDFKFKDFLSSTEKTANLVLYNLPIFLAFFAILLGLDYSLKHFFLGNNNITASLLLNSDSAQILKTATSPWAEAKLIAVKYLKLLFELFWLCLLFVFYNRKRALFYSHSIFEQNENENENL